MTTPRLDLRIFYCSFFIAVIVMFTIYFLEKSMWKEAIATLATSAVFLGIMVFSSVKEGTSPTLSIVGGVFLGYIVFVAGIFPHLITLYKLGGSFWKTPFHFDDLKIKARY